MVNKLRFKVGDRVRVIHFYYEEYNRTVENFIRKENKAYDYLIGQTAIIIKLIKGNYEPGYQLRWEHLKDNRNVYGWEDDELEPVAIEIDSEGNIW